MQLETGIDRISKSFEKHDDKKGNYNTIYHQIEQYLIKTKDSMSQIKQYVSGKLSSVPNDLKQEILNTVGKIKFT